MRLTTRKYLLDVEISDGEGYLLGLGIRKGSQKFEEDYSLRKVPRGSIRKGYLEGLALY